MRLYLSILFDRPIDPSKGLPSPGGYEVRTKDGKVYGFDFNESRGGPSTTQPCVVEWTLRDEDTLTFPDINELRTKLQDIEAITDCYIDLEGYENPADAPKPLAILDFAIEDSLPADAIEPQSNDNVIVHHMSTTDNIIIYEFSDKLKASYIFDALRDIKTISVHISFNLDVDISDINPECVNVIGLAKALTLKEFENEIANNNYVEDYCEIIGTDTKSYL